MKTTKKIMMILAASGLAFSLSACTSGTANTKRGAVAGGLIGAAAGGIIGHQSGRGLEGAAIGAGAGSLGGGVLGSAKDEEQDR